MNIWLVTIGINEYMIIRHGDSQYNKGNALSIKWPWDLYI